MVIRIDDWVKNGKGFMLKDDYLLSNTGHGGLDDDTWSGKFKGRMAVLRAINYEEFTLDATTYPGRFPIFWIMLTIVPKHANFHVIKFDEGIHFGFPMHKTYMAGLEHQKEELEKNIKQGLISISQSVADLELLEHDIRKYKEYKKYLDDYFSTDESKKKDKKIADRFLKMIFVEQVDYHVGSTGQGPGRFSMAFLRNNNLMPTIVDDFLEIEKIEDIEEMFKQGKISGAEKNLLLTKFKSFNEWLNMFKETVERRLKRMEELKRSREKTLEEFKNWLRPHIIRLKALNMSIENKGMGKEYKKFAINSQVTGIYVYSTTLWLFRHFTTPWDRMEYKKPLVDYDFSTKDDDEYYEHPLNPYNKWTRENLIFNYDYGLLADYPWITKDLADNYAIKAWKEYLKDRKDTIYHLFLNIEINDSIFSPIEIEDIEIKYRPFILSHNVVLAKLMENEAHGQEFDFEVEEFMGHISSIDGKTIVTYYKKGNKYYITPRFIEKWLNSKHDSWVYKLHRERIEETKRRISNKFKNINDLSEKGLSYKDMQDIFPENSFYYVKNSYENKAKAYIEDNILGHSLRWKYDLPYQTNFTDAVTYMFYRKMAKDMNRFVVDPIKGLLKIPGKDGF